MTKVRRIIVELVDAADAEVILTGVEGRPFDFNPVVVPAGALITRHSREVARRRRRDEGLAALADGIEYAIQSGLERGSQR